MWEESYEAVDSRAARLIKMKPKSRFGLVRLWNLNDIYYTQCFIEQRLWDQ